MPEYVDAEEGIPCTQKVTKTNVMGTTARLTRHFTQADLTISASMDSPNCDSGLKNYRCACPLLT